MANAGIAPPACNFGVALMLAPSSAQHRSIEGLIQVKVDETAGREMTGEQARDVGPRRRIDRFGQWPRRAQFGQEAPFGLGHPQHLVWRAVLAAGDAAMAAIDLAAGPVWLMVERDASEVAVRG